MHYISDGFRGMGVTITTLRWLSCHMCQKCYNQTAFVPYVPKLLQSDGFCVTYLNIAAIRRLLCCMLETDRCRIGAGLFVTPVPTRLTVGESSLKCLGNVDSEYKKVGGLSCFFSYSKSSANRNRKNTFISNTNLLQHALLAYLPLCRSAPWCPPGCWSCFGASRCTDRY